MNIPVKVLAALFITIGQSDGVETTVSMSVPPGKKMFIDDEVILDVWSEYDPDDETMNLWMETRDSHIAFDMDSNMEFDRITVYEQSSAKELVVDRRGTVYNTELWVTHEEGMVPALELKPGMKVCGLVATYEYDGSPNLPIFSSDELTIKRVEKLPNNHGVNVWYEGPFNSKPDCIHHSWFVSIK
jgi:hypothetical protein